jgi:hypothetical protein
VDEKGLAALQRSNDRDRRLTDLSGLPPQDAVRRVHKGTDGAAAESGG